MRKRHTVPAKPLHPDELVEVVKREHSAAVLAYATMLTGDHAAAEDVLQETLVRAWRHRAALGAGDGSLRGWLLTVARNIVIDGVRRARAVPTAPVDMAVRDHADRIADYVAVTRALRQLRPHHREVLFRLYYEDLSVAQAAADLDVPEGTVKSRSHYAVRALRRELTWDKESA